jgi:hypothetical protein
MKKQILAPTILALSVASAAHAGATFDTAAGTLNLGADVEFDYTSETDRDLFSGGRLLLDINGMKVLDNGYFVGFKFNPTYGQNGSLGVDDVWFKFGAKENWALQTGHFEASDLSPAGQDTYLMSPTIVMYRANFARGRTGESDYDNDPTTDNAQTGDGQMTYTKTMGDSANFEITAQSLNNGNVMVLRPVITATPGDIVSLGFGAEFSAYGDDETPFAETVSGTQTDATDWFGLGGYVAFAAAEDLTITVRGAYLSDDRVETNSLDAYSVGLNLQYADFFIGAIYGDNDADLAAEDKDETQVYASYRIADVMNFDNFDIYVGAAWSEATVNGTTQDDIVGGRVRLKYTF